MAGSVNKAIIVGHLGGDPDVTTAQSGRQMARFSVATSETWKDQATGEKKEKTTWHRVVIFSEGLAKVAGQYLKKGSKVYVEGSMETRDWTDTQGVKRYVTEIIVRGFGDSIVLLDRAGGGGVPANDGATEDSSRPAPRSASRDLDDDIPF
ncbi:TPA: single-stranded DNA-binding protein [Escherichia coli]|jgi:single-strand DNA-binding protein